MMHPDHDSPEQLTNCISAITLKALPQGFVEEWLSEDKADVAITVAPQARPHNRTAKPWLRVDELDALPWTGKVREATLLSDHLEDSAALLNLSAVERMTISILGDKFHHTDLAAFHNAIMNLVTLRQLRIVVSEPALAVARDHMLWPSQDLNCEVATEARDGNALRRVVRP